MSRIKIYSVNRVCFDRYNANRSGRHRLQTRCPDPSAMAHSDLRGVANCKSDRTIVLIRVFSLISRWWLFPKLHLQQYAAIHHVLHIVLAPLAERFSYHSAMLQRRTGPRHHHNATANGTTTGLQHNNVQYNCQQH